MKFKLIALHALAMISCCPAYSMNSKELTRPLVGATEKSFAANIESRWVSFKKVLVNATGVYNREMRAAVWDGNLAKVQDLLDRGVDINATDGRGRTMLMHAAMLGRTDMIQSLLKAGADVDIKDKDGRTAFDHAKFAHVQISAILSNTES